MKFFKCNHCGNVISYVEDMGIPVECCGEIIEELEVGVEDASHEKHVPVVEVNGQKVIVSVGSVAHPMISNHCISWVAVQTKQGNQRKTLKVGQEPKVCFSLCTEDEVVAVYAYCNIHGLWKA